MYASREWQRLKEVFFKSKWYLFNGLILISLIFFSLTAEVWSHSEPLFIWRKIDNKNHFYSPFLWDYDAIEFGVHDIFVIDFKELQKEDKSHGIPCFYLFPLNPWDAEEQSSQILSAPSLTHLLGTDLLGRDVFARALYGLRISLGFGLLVWAFSFTLGIFIGVMQGYFSRHVDFISERIKEVVALIPALTVILILSSVFDSINIWLMAFITSLFSWLGISSQMRIQTYALKEATYLESAKSLGASFLHMMRKHIIPNLLTTILILTPFQIEAGIATLMALDYLSFGLPPPTPSLGELLSQGQTVLTRAPWMVGTGIASFLLLLLSLMFVGQGIKEALTPKDAS
jgi:microcin C transport system permease protein